MDLPVFILDGDYQRSRQLVQLLKNRGYMARRFKSWPELPDISGRAVVLVNLDTVQTNTRQLMEAGQNNTDLVLLTLSGQTYHPELSRAMQERVFASLCEPLDQEELFFWLRSISQLENGLAG